jgi:Glucosamine-6-phosphate isomerases/6-phosphogluconolactonase
MTLTYPALAWADEIIWLVTGASKHEALNRLLAGDRSIPAARVQARRSVIFADAPAVDGPPPTFQGAIFDIDGVLVQQALADAGADLVVRTLGEVSRPALGEGRLALKTEG